MTVSTVLYWAPRVLGLLFAAFLSLFALDAFSEALTRDAVWPALLMHLLPAIAVGIVVAVAWRYELAGAILFAAAGAAYAVATREHPSWILAIAGPMFLEALLFAVSYRSRIDPVPIRSDAKS